MDKSISARQPTLYAFEKVDLEYESSFQKKISTISSMVTTKELDGKIHDVVIFFRKDVAVENLVNKKSMLKAFKSERKETEKHLKEFLRGAINDSKITHTKKERSIHTIMNRIRTETVATKQYTKEGQAIIENRLAGLFNNKPEVKDNYDQSVKNSSHKAHIKTKYLKFIDAKLFDVISSTKINSSFIDLSKKPDTPPST